MRRKKDEGLMGRGNKKKREKEKSKMDKDPLGSWREESNKELNGIGKRSRKYKFELYKEIKRRRE